MSNMALGAKNALQQEVFFFFEQEEVKAKIEGGLYLAIVFGIVIIVQTKNTVDIKKQQNFTEQNLIQTQTQIYTSFANCIPVFPSIYSSGLDLIPFIYLIIRCIPFYTILFPN